MKFTLLSLCCVLLTGTGTIYAQTDVLTQHNDLQRTGWNSQETKLNIKNVKAGPFAKLFTCAVDDQVYAQPLVATNVNIPAKGSRNIVYVATVNNSVHAFDADSARAAPYWQINLTPTGTRPPQNSDLPNACSGHYLDFTGKIGIVGTPVIDKTTNTMYLVSRAFTTDGSNTFSTYLHALDIMTGAEKKGGPVAITAQVNGTGDDNISGVITFSAKRENQRPGLLLLNGIVYIGFASHCDLSPYHGWLLGYDTATLQQKIVYNTTPDGIQGGIWMSGAAPSADQAGNIYLSTGNGTVGLESGANPSYLGNRGESAVKLVLSGNSLTVGSFFTPFNYADLDDADLDFGVTEVLLIPNTNLALTGCKDGNLYLMNRDNMGGVGTSSNNVLQTIGLGSQAHLRSSLGYYKGSTHEYVYTWSENAALKAFPVNRSAGNLDVANTVTSGIQGPVFNNGATMSTSSNGAVDSTGILWASHAVNCNANLFVCPGILRAINANDVTQELWNSTLNPSDSVGNYAKFVCPTVANGKVYLATFSNQLLVYGLTNNGVDTCNSMNVALNKTAMASSVQSAGTPASAAFDGNLATGWASNAGNTEFIYVDLGAKYDLCRLVLHWGNAFGKDYDIQVSDDAQIWISAQSIRGNSNLTNTLNLHASGRYVRMQGVTQGNSSGYSINEMEVYGTLTVICAVPSGLNAGNLSASGATVNWQPTGNATGYTLQYKQVSDAGWIQLITGGTSVTLQTLSCGTDYIYQVKANCSSGQNSAFSASAGFSTLACNNNCGALPTRWNTTDIGNTGVAGMACYNGGAYSIQGSGADIGGNADAFRFAYVNLVGDDEFLTRVAGQDATDPANKAGIMIRETLLPGSRNAFIALTSGQGATFQYRNATGGGTSVNSVSGPSAAYWIKLQKSGSRYTGLISPDGFVWTQLGSPVDLGFGADNGATYVGIAVTSHNNSLLSTAIMDNFSQATVLSVSLTSFTGKAINDQYVQLQWVTASEENNDHFEVERSRDGMNFSNMAIVKAVGNSSTPLQYSAEDREPGTGVNYYRLKLVDLDGRSSYSPVILVRCGKRTAPILFPNPVNAVFTIIAGQEPVKEISVFDISGRNMLHRLNVTGTSSMVISCAGLAAGIYVVQIRTGMQTYVQKLIKR